MRTEHTMARSQLGDNFFLVGAPRPSCSEPGLFDRRNRAAEAGRDRKCTSRSRAHLAHPYLYSCLAQEKGLTVTRTAITGVIYQLERASGTEFLQPQLALVHSGSRPGKVASEVAVPPQQAYRVS